MQNERKRIVNTKVNAREKQRSKRRDRQVTGHSRRKNKVGILQYTNLERRSKEEHPFTCWEIRLPPRTPHPVIRGPVEYCSEPPVRECLWDGNETDTPGCSKKETNWPNRRGASGYGVILSTVVGRTIRAAQTVSAHAVSLSHIQDLG